MVTLELQNAALDYEVPDAAEFQTWGEAIHTPQNKHQLAAVRIVDEKEMTSLNGRYRHKQGATNVLSFPAELHEDVNIPFIGEVVICAPVVINEAIQQGKIAQSHWAHMTVHGILHLQGYDHLNEADATQMESLEIQVMNTLGFNNPYS